MQLLTVIHRWTCSECGATRDQSHRMILPVQREYLVMPTIPDDWSQAPGMVVCEKHGIEYRVVSREELWQHMAE